ncbi:SphA family protein [Microvirga antarctica]|uniref:SphA family protein n=1 Tax=Microvirga antarctica TaxID=2819233 RepID=UPI001B30F1A0|nr:transporter [Microvirga antarctica]
MALSAPSASLADEGGVPFWLSGQYGSLSAVPPQKGWALTAMPYLYEGGSQGRTFQRGRSLAAGIDGTTALTLLQLSYSPDATFLGGKPSFGLGFGVGGSWTRAAASVSALPIGSSAALSRKDSVGGLLDLYPIFTNSWSRGVHNWMVYVTGDIPTGAYRSSRLSNLGIGHAAVDAGGGYTYLDTTSGHEASIVIGATYNFENWSTDYKNGIDLHIDWAASQFVTAQWQIGIVGYIYSQLTGDGGSGDKVGPFQSAVAALGPQVGYSFTVGKKSWYANLRLYREFWAHNRVRGTAAFLTLNMPLGD